MLAKLSGINAKGRYVSLEKEKQTFSVVLTYSIKGAREIRKFHVAVVQQRLRNVKKSVMHEERCFFLPILTYCFFVVLRCRCKNSLLLLHQKFCYHANVTSHFSSLLNINLIFSWLLRRDIWTPQFVFLWSSKNKFQVRETLLMVSLQAKVAPSHIGANHLLGLKRLRDQGLGDSIKLSEIKKNKTNKKHISFINTADLTITNNFHFKNKTNYNWRFYF